MCIKCDSEEKTVNETLDERAKTHGDFDTYCSIMDRFTDEIQEGGELTSEQNHGLYMIFSKIARILNGDKNHADSWHDIAGYATLVERSINND